MMHGKSTQNAINTATALTQCFSVCLRHPDSTCKSHLSAWLQTLTVHLWTPRQEIEESRLFLAS